MTEDSREHGYKERIKDNLDNVLHSGFIPELGHHYEGKVRDVHFSGSNVGDLIYMTASDRVSCFDHVLDDRIPFKGMVLNLLTNFFMLNIPGVNSAMQPSPHANLLTQKFCERIDREIVLRGFLWGSAAKAYESGERTVCGHTFNEGLHRYSNLGTVAFTPTTKEDNDAPSSWEDIRELLGSDKASELETLALRTWDHGSDIAKRNGLYLIDTKFEFGFDENKEIVLIDECLTPDSSRYCDIEDWKRVMGLIMENTDRSAESVKEYLESNKIQVKELSKEFVRGALKQQGFSYGSPGRPPRLTEEQIIETSYRYIRLYETITGKEFSWPAGNVQDTLMQSLVSSGYAKGVCAVVLAGSGSDEPHVRKIVRALDKYEIPWNARVCSAHKQMDGLQKIVSQYAQSLEPIIYIAVAGGADALSGCSSYNPSIPVISCPPDKPGLESALASPPGSSNAVIPHPKNVARFAAQYFGNFNPVFHDKIRHLITQKNLDLLTADNLWYKQGKLNPLPESD